MSLTPSQAYDCVACALIAGVLWMVWWVGKKVNREDFGRQGGAVNWHLTELQLEDLLELGITVYIVAFL